MRREEHRWHSPSLGREMALLLYGEGPQPVIAFPSQNGRHWDWEGFGMIDAIADLLEDRRITVATVDTVAAESWTNPHAEPRDRTLAYAAAVERAISSMRCRRCTAPPPGPAQRPALAGRVSRGNLFFRRRPVRRHARDLRRHSTRRGSATRRGGDLFQRSAGLPAGPDPCTGSVQAQPHHVRRWQGRVRAKRSHTRHLQSILESKGRAGFDEWGRRGAPLALVGPDGAPSSSRMLTARGDSPFTKRSA